MVNGKKYVGLSNEISRRFMEHKTPKNVKNKNTILAKAFRKYSIDNFRFEILEIVSDEYTLEEREIYWIEKLRPEYNMNKGGKGNTGQIVSDELRQLLKAFGKTQWATKTDLEKQKIINYNLTGPKKGHGVSKETRQKLRNANLGKKQSAETKLKRSKALKKSAIGNQNGNKKILCFENGVLLCEFDSVVLGAKFANIHPSNITCVLKGRQLTAGGYKWKYKLKDK